MYLVYKITNKTNGKAYIGQTQQTFTLRRYNHIQRARDGVNRPLYNAMRRDGVKNFSWEILYECSDKKEMDKKERYYIRKFHSVIPGGYNLTAGGEGAKHHLTTIEKMKQRFITNNPAKRPEVKEKMSRNHADVSGEKNPNAKEWKVKNLIDDTAKIYKSLSSFCVENGYNHKTVRRAVTKYREYKNYSITPL
jgi:group I intron endonuclease